MKLRSLDISGFRAISDRLSIDLDAEVILVVGPNGAGKTSILDAILWALTGRLARFPDDVHKVVSLYSTSGQTRVRLVIGSSERDSITIIRTTDDEKSQLQVIDGDRVHNGTLAEALLISRLTPGPTEGSPEENGLSTILTRGLYLQQDVVREFIERDTKEKRFEVVSRLLGAGKLTELQIDLEKSRAAWSRETTRRERDIDELERSRDELTVELRRLDGAEQPGADISNEWNEWWSQLSGVISEMPTAPGFGPDARNTLDVTLRQLQTLLAVEDRAFSQVSSALTELQAEENKLPALDVQIRDLEQQLQAVTAHLQTLKAGVAEFQRAIADQPRQAEDSAADLRALAALALRHLGDRCPVCDQDYDHESTRQRLQRLLTAMSIPVEQDSASDKLASITAEISDYEGQANATNLRLSLARQEKQFSEFRIATVSDRMAEAIASMPGSDVAGKLRGLRDQTQSRRDLLKRLVSHGERYALALARLTETARRDTIEKKLQLLSGEIEERRRQINSHWETHSVAGSLIEHIRESAATAVESQLKKLEPVLNRIYARIDPHPSFTDASIATELFRGRGLMSLYLKDPVRGFGKVDPLPVLSSSQLNALAISTFLAMNLSLSSLPLRSLILDDPLQNLDDINLLGLVDALRRIKPHRQLLISTHDRKLAGLLERKLRPIGAEARTTTIRIDSWSRTGPVFYQADTPRIDAAVRVVAAE